MQLEDNFKTYQKVKKRQQKRTFPVNMQEGYCQNNSLFGQLDFSLPISEASLTPIFESYLYDVEMDRENSGFSVEKQKKEK
jgi:hypothetical protein